MKRVGICAFNHESKCHNGRHGRLVLGSIVHKCLWHTTGCLVILARLTPQSVVGSRLRFPATGEGATGSRCQPGSGIPATAANTQHAG